MTLNELLDTLIRLKTISGLPGDTPIAAFDDHGDGMELEIEDVRIEGGGAAPRYVAINLTEA